MPGTGGQFCCTLNSGPMYHPASLCDANDFLLFGLLLITTIVPDGDSGVLL